MFSLFFAEVKIRRGNRDYLGIIFLIFLYILGETVLKRGHNLCFH